MTHLHLDPLGGIAGDMFVAALLDAMPEHATAVGEAVRALTGIEARLVAHRDHVLGGRRFEVPAPPAHDHDHTHWSAIRARIAGAPLSEAVIGHALGIFGVLAEAEASVHGVAVGDVAFHEVGAVDSIADIIAAAVMIAACGAASWSVGPLPLGGGRVRTAHGPMPVPAPATTLLLRNFAFVDDGVAGERVTPTGAAILRHLNATSGPGPAALRLAASGTGFGTRTLPGLSNCLRVLVFETAGTSVAEHRTLCVIGFEVDDQTPEDLATGLDRLRAVAGVHDVLQMSVVGKKGRLATHVQVLTRPDAAEAVAAACFRETTTIGLRLQRVEGRALPRSLHAVDVSGAAVGVKLVERPGGLRTAKSECDDARELPNHAARENLRREAERLALEAAP